MRLSQIIVGALALASAAGVGWYGGSRGVREPAASDASRARRTSGRACAAAETRLDACTQALRAMARKGNAEERESAATTRIPSSDDGLDPPEPTQPVQIERALPPETRAEVRRIAEPLRTHAQAPFHD